MRFRKHSAKSQPIRKRKNKSSKQTLAKAAARKNLSEQRRVHKLLDADARILRARLDSVNASSKVIGRESVPDLKPRSLSSILEVSEQGNALNTSDYDDDIENVYEILKESLVHPLRSSLEPDATDKPNQRNVATHDKRNKQRAVNSAAPPLPQPSSLDIEFVNSDGEEDWTGNVEAELRNAVQREILHFGTSQPSEPPQAYTTVAKFATLRVSAAVSDVLGSSISALVTGESPISLGVQPSTLSSWRKHPTFRSAINGQKTSPLLRGFAATLRSYCDLLLCARIDECIDDAVRAMYVAHIVAHILRARSRVVKNNVMLRNERGLEDTFANVRDQGFSRARAVIIVPMKNVAYDVVSLVIRLAGGGKDGMVVVNQCRFKDEFGPDAGEENGDCESPSKRGTQAHDNSQKVPTVPKGGIKPADYSRTFRGNIDDDFKLGIAFSKRSIKLYTEFYDSDLIVASPLGLRRESAAKAIGQDRYSKAMRAKRKQEEDEEWVSGIDSKHEKKEGNANDDGFLSSIEICVVDGANIFSMQNWDTLKRVMGMLNKMPSNTRDTDFSRVREWCLDGQMGKYRQSIVISRYRKSEFMALFREFRNHSGKVQLIESPSKNGICSDLRLRIRQTFFKVPDAATPLESMEKRMVFFFNHTFPIVQALSNSKILLVVPSYFDFVRVRNKLLKIVEEDPSLSFSSISEYSRFSDVTRARARLFNGEIKLLIITERFHFFWRHRIRGANTIAWFALPENAEFYPEVLDMTTEAADKGHLVQSFAMYDKFDTFSLERILGATRCQEMTSKMSRTSYIFE